MGLFVFFMVIVFIVICVDAAERNEGEDKKSNTEGRLVEASQQPPLDQLTFDVRIEQRNPKRHHSNEMADDRSCRICGSTRGCNCMKQCELEIPRKIQEPFLDELRLEDLDDYVFLDLEKQYRRLVWIAQHCIAIDLYDGVISEETARKEIHEETERYRVSGNEEVRFRRRIKREKQDNDKTLHELNTIVKRLS